MVKSESEIREAIAILESRSPNPVERFLMRPLIGVLYWALDQEDSMKEPFSRLLDNLRLLEGGEDATTK